jgi:hypothetical protein
MVGKIGMICWWFESNSCIFRTSFQYGFSKKYKRRRYKRKSERMMKSGGSRRRENEKKPDCQK